mgnify:CR=1 FL=1
MQSKELIEIAVKALDSKKAKDIEVINIEGLTMLGDYLVIASGSSNTQVRALSEEVEYKLSEKGVEPLHIEGRTTQWYLLDYGDVMIHVFHTDARNFYALERMWSDGEKVDISDLLTKE